MFNRIKEAFENGDMISGSTPDVSDNTNTSGGGIVQDHVYTILGVIETEDGDRLLRIRNPWGRETFTGETRDRDSNDEGSFWTQDLKDELNFIGGNDGIFYIDYETYHAEMSST